VRGDLLDVSPESYDLNFAVNTRGAFFLTQTVYRQMLAVQPTGPESARSIIFISSTFQRGERHRSAASNAMSKAAVAMMAKLFAVRLAPIGIVVYEVRPGLIKTPMTGVTQERFTELRPPRGPRRNDLCQRVIGWPLRSASARLAGGTDAARGRGLQRRPLAAG
jgi:3-oxoacyl-[acyl-carrier protein] reductase